jgi:hypothetical protein
MHYFLLSTANSTPKIGGNQLCSIPTILISVSDCVCRPQLLVICPDLEGAAHDGLLAFVSQLKAGKGLTLMAHVIQGDFTEQSQKAIEYKAVHTLYAHDCLLLVGVI